MSTYKLTAAFSVIFAWFTATQAVAAESCHESENAEPKLIALVTSQLNEQFSGQNVVLQVETVGEVPTLRDADVKLLSHDLRSRVAAEVKGYACETGIQRTATVWFRVEAMQEVWVYARNASAGGPVSDALPRREQVDIARLQLQPTDASNELEGMWLTESVRAGRPALKRQLQPEPLVKRDQAVQVMVVRRGLALSTLGRAVGSGQLGDQVPVLLDGVGSSIVAVVSGKGEVHVQR